MANSGGDSNAVSNVAEPEHLLCPITRVLFIDPVLTSSGKVYERAALILHWDGKGIPHDPLTNAVLADSTLNIAVDERCEVAAFLQSNPSYLPDGWATREVPEANDRQWVPQAKAGAANALDASYQRHFFQPLLDTAKKRLDGVLLANRALMACSVFWLLWVAVFICVLFRYQIPIRGTDNLQQEQGMHIYHLASWTVRVLLLIVGLFHIFLTYRLVRKARELIKDANALNVPPASTAVMSFVAYAATEMVILLTLLVLLYEGLFRYSSEDDTGYEVNTNVGGPISCLHDAHDLGFNTKTDCEDSFMARFKMLLGGLCILDLVSMAVGFYSQKILWSILRAQPQSSNVGTSPVEIGRHDDPEGNFAGGPPHNDESEDGPASI